MNFYIMKLDSKGNIIAGSLAILIISLLIVFIFVFTSMNYIENENIESNGNNYFKFIVDDYTNNLEGQGLRKLSPDWQRRSNKKEPG